MASADRPAGAEDASVVVLASEFKTGSVADGIGIDPADAGSSQFSGMSPGAAMVMLWVAMTAMASTNWMAGAASVADGSVSPMADEGSATTVSCVLTMQLSAPSL